MKTNDQLVSSQDSPTSLETNGRSHVTSGAKCAADRSGLTKRSPDVVYSPEDFLRGKL